MGDASEFVVGGAAQLTYGLTNRLYAPEERPSARRAARRGEFLTVGLQQTVYSNPESARYDSTYQSTFEVHAAPMAHHWRHRPRVSDFRDGRQFSSGIRYLRSWVAVVVGRGGLLTGVRRRLPPITAGGRSTAAITSRLNSTLRWLDGTSQRHVFS